MVGRFFKRVKLRFFLLQLENDSREEDRKIRQSIIKEQKKSLILDLMTGHNIGDFRIRDGDFSTLQKISTNTPISVIRALHSKYR